MERKKSRLKWSLLAVLTICFLSACGEEKTVDYTIEGITDVALSQSETGQVGLAQFEGEEVWVETLKNIKRDEIISEWDGQLHDLRYDLDVNAQIILPDADGMVVVETKEPEFDAAFKEMMAENLFDSEEVYYGDAAHLPKRDLQQIQDYIAGGGVISGYSPDYKIERKEEVAELYGILEHIEDAKETYTPVTEYNVNEYIGTYEGLLYRLSFAERTGDTNNEYRRVKQITWTVKDLYEVCPEKFKEVENLVCSTSTVGNWVENQCEISEEEALKEAEAFVEKLGLDYPVYSHSMPLLWGTPPDYVNENSASDDWGVNGYVFFFDLGVDGISFVDFGMEEDYAAFGRHNDKEIQYSMEARLQVYVTDAGVIRMIANNPLEITGVSESVNLLPLDTIKSIMRVEIDAKWDVLLFKDEVGVNRLDSMELIYFRISDKENPGKYSYVPVWRLATVTRNLVTKEISITYALLINAIDGSFVNFDEET